MNKLRAFKHTSCLADCLIACDYLIQSKILKHSTIFNP